jgi:tetratricopeptide (TPR) repeat protein
VVAVSFRWLNNVMDGGWGQGWIGVYGRGPADHNLVEGNIVKGVGQLSPVYKPAIQVSGAYNTVRRNVVLSTKSWGLEVSSFDGGTASYNLIYNNVFYDSGGCYFQSSSRGIKAYSNVVYANNICYKLRDIGFRIYLGNVTNRNIGNDILAVDVAARPQPERAFVIWNQLGGGSYENPKSIGEADRGYDPVFSRNKALSVAPGFVNEKNFDFHLRQGSPLVAAGFAIADAEWGSTAGPADLGAFGISISKPVYGAADPAMDLARASDYAGAAKAVSGRTNMPHALSVEAALLRAAFDDAAAAAVLARIGTPAAGDLMGRFERVRQGTADPPLWDLLGANPERVLEMADLYIQWGLLRDALVLVTHRYVRPSPAMTNALMLYYRSYCRDLLDYVYYAGEDLRTAGTLPTKDLTPRFPGALQVFQWAVQRNPSDANAHWFLALVYQSAGREVAAREVLQNALKLRPGFPDAETLLAKLGPGSPVSAKIRPAGGGSAPDAPAATTATATAANSPADIAATALRLAASGDIGGAMSYFTPSRFPKEKQENAVHEAYIELRLRQLVAMAAARQCPAVIQGLTNLDAEDKSLPFTFNGFGSFTRGIRFQYWLGIVEFACVDETAARKRWEKLSKTTPEIASADYVYPYMALAKLDANEGKIQARKALVFLQRQLAASPEHQGVLLYNQGLLQMIAGHKDEAAASFRAGAAAGPSGMTEYLNLDAIRMLDAER